jgi:hypothetical protein
MEAHAFEKNLATLTDDLKYPVASVTTDKHSSISLLMRTKYKQIAHFLDSWHVTKNFRKKLVAVRVLHVIHTTSYSLIAIDDI